MRFSGCSEQTCALYMYYQYRYTEISHLTYFFSSAVRTMVYDLMTKSPCLGIFPLSTFQKHIAKQALYLKSLLPEHRIVQMQPTDKVPPPPKKKRMCSDFFLFVCGFLTLCTVHSALCTVHCAQRDTTTGTENNNETIFMQNNIGNINVVVLVGREFLLYGFSVPDIFFLYPCPSKFAKIERNKNSACVESICKSVCV